MLPRGFAKKKSLHEVPTAIVNCLQMRDALPKDPKAMKINIRGSNTPKICRIKIIGLGLVKSDEEGNSLTRRIMNCGKITANLKLRGCRDTSTGVGPRKIHEI